MTDTPTGYAPDLDAAVRERQGAPVPKVRIVVPPRHRIYGGDDGDGYPYGGVDMAEDGRWMDACDVIAAIRKAGAVAVDGQGREL
jgi:hypothetical protein